VRSKESVARGSLDSTCSDCNNNNVTTNNRLIFLGGAPRSGTTLLQNMLDCHPEILGGPEFLHIPDIVNLRDKLHDSVSRGWISLICSADEVDKRIRSLINDFLLPFADKHGGQYLSEKTPENILVFSKLIELFPDSRFIHIVRDPRAVVASLLAVGDKARQKGEKPAPFAANLNSAIAYVRRCMDAGFKAKREAPEKVRTIVYEQLVRDPVGESQGLCRFLGIDWDQAMTRPGEMKHLGEAAITTNSNEIWYDAKTYYSNPNADSLEKWRSTLSPYQQIAVHRAFQNHGDLQQLGYDLSPADLGFVSQVNASLLLALSRVRSRIGVKIRQTVRM